MKNLFNDKGKDEIISRLEKLKDNSPGQWGKMNSNQMLCHCADQLRLANGEKHSVFSGSLLTTTLLKWLILTILKAPKGKVKTVKELKQGAGGSAPTNFENDKKLLIALIDNFDKSFETKKFFVHPAFGKMDHWQWGRLAYTHLDHHFRQFGV
ncbi:MAG: hypothetical protein CO127_05280 [Ignavibacteria bacterium CG_4_9_14_3_um_filter_36_18]|nr:DUF1569 domain-containing protein [Ignavibacteria bacterium]PJB01156.1 MAG: hypothetical protein CO127_05280 [Ignavibacteria bacterium CG_4_9_14_3_um_filter_36_18]